MTNWGYERDLKFLAGPHGIFIYNEIFVKLKL